MEHKHKWLGSYEHLGLVGSLYRWIWPYVCECGALKSFDGTILEPNPNPSMEDELEKELKDGTTPNQV